MGNITSKKSMLFSAESVSNGFRHEVISLIDRLKKFNEHEEKFKLEEERLSSIRIDPIEAITELFEKGDSSINHKCTKDSTQMNEEKFDYNGNLNDCHNFFSYGSKERLKKSIGRMLLSRSKE